MLDDPSSHYAFLLTTCSLPLLSPQALFDLEATNNELKSDLRDLYINSAQEVEVTSGRSAIVIHVSHQPHQPPAPSPALSCTRRIGSRPRGGTCTATTLVAPRVKWGRARRAAAPCPRPENSVQRDACERLA